MTAPKLKPITIKLPKEVAELVLKLNPTQLNQVLELGLNVVKTELIGGERREPTMLHKAADLIAGDRQQDYGDKLQNFSQIAMLFQGTLAHKLMPNKIISPEDVAMLMIQVKIARLAKSPDHKDSILDVAGYAGCYSILQQEREQGTELLGATQDYRAFEQ